ncbi:MAG: DegT/DnrJ/EryC1/StrS family aminotransferase [Bacteroidales bacterium]|jgi:UDP-2-acetamido-2-deoxy-ribo-hexuluronate aminotransferase|nr:DegT/DnrJ/EryC1/StrS family aminotransferase [Bacteroidales bacterium]
MQFRDLIKQYESLKSEIDHALLTAVASGHYIMGKEVTELEHCLADYVGVKHCITCANGTDALTLALKVWQIGPGDAVFVPDFTFIATAEVVSLEGATPVFVDVDSRSFNICTQSLEKAIQRTLSEGKLTPKAIIPVDLFGLPANYPAISEIAKKYQLWVLEDGAQGFGGAIGQQKACSFGDISTTSFFPAKPLGCYGDGGAVFTDNDDWADHIRSLKVHGKGTDKYDNVRIGLNSRLDTLQAAILLPKFEAFKNEELDKVNQIASLYTQRLSTLYTTPWIPDGYYSSWAQYTLIMETNDQRNKLQHYLKEHGIPTMVYYPKPMHAQTAYAHLNYTAAQNPVSHSLSQTVLSLPMHPYLTEEEVNRVCDKILEFKG